MTRQQPEIWRPITGMPAGQREGHRREYEGRAAEWLADHKALKDGPAARRFVNR